MRTSSKVIGAAAAAALVVAGGSAFTAANTVPTTVVAGYGSSTVSGVEVAEMQIVPSGANVGSVVYTVEAANVSSYTFALSGDATDSAARRCIPPQTPLSRVNLIPQLRSPK